MERLPFKLRRARLQLMLKHPYLASAVARFPICIRTDKEGFPPWRPTVTDLCQWEFVERISSDQLLGVLAHELMHNLLGHLEREQGRDPARWNVAIDHATNLMLEEMNFTLPDPKCCDRRFYGLTAEEIYKQLPDGRDAENWDLHLSADLKKAPDHQTVILSVVSKKTVIPMILRPVWRNTAISPLLLNSSVSAKVCGVR